ncbi:hypothetical protein KIW84_062534 [Lathyrus oleraceus]|uniref:Uncharacterized protein n=1 Tax=Pisum sativum TaxID=3888 RepID=A0A9D5A609_PEA|nr:hypothetical protein KIW84_062534 [Pisum sativum]
MVGPITITVPGPVPYEKDSAIPWHYGADIYFQGQKVNEEDIDIGSSAVNNVGGVGGFTRSGRLFAPSTLRTNTEAEAAAKAKGKQVSTEEVTTEEDPPKTAFEKEVDEFMRIIKKSDYKAHRAALLKVLNMAYVPPEITVNQLESVVSNVNASWGLGFTDNDLTPEGRNHNKALHITMECKGVVLSHVLVDTGSSLNVLPKKALMKLDCDGIILRPSNLVVRAFDGSKRAVFGEVEFPVKIGPQVFKITFYVMDIQPAYSCLLSRPWIHVVGVVTSTLHQKLKYELEGQIVTVCGEEDIFVSHLSTFKYVEMDGEMHEMLCQGFETTNINEVAPEAVFSPGSEKVGTSISSYKQAVEVVKAGNAQGWGNLWSQSSKKTSLDWGMLRDFRRMKSVLSPAGVWFLPTASMLQMKTRLTATVT